MSPQDYTAWQQAIQAARTRASLHTLEHRVREFGPDAEALQLRQLCGERRGALAAGAPSPPSELRPTSERRPPLAAQRFAPAVDTPDVANKGG
jgi:hypothetical protein